MEEIKVNEYVRTENGLIRKIKSIEKQEATENCPVDIYWCNLDKPIIILKECSKDTIYAIEKSNAEKLKHSPNIIDLIEVGDYVNGYKVSDKESTLLFTNVKGIDRSGYHIPISQYGDGIETILTKEQYQANCYKVGGEEC